jgi:hypothetical protein
MRTIQAFAVVMAAVLLAACTNTRDVKATTATFQWQSAEKRIAVIEPDVVLGELTAAGLFEPRADWTQAGKEHIRSEMARYFEGRGVRLAMLDPATEHRDIQLVKLHGVVGRAVLLHLFIQGNELPTKGKALDWTLGSGTQGMRTRLGADYGLFIYVRDSYTTAGRALMMLGAAILGVGITGGQQVAFASLVDLNTGNIVWFNLLQSSSGDLRTPDAARKVVAALMKDNPL